MQRDTAGLPRRNDALQARIATLSAAVLRISASLDLDIVLQEAVDSAGALTSARYGVIATVDEEGRTGDSVTSGFTPEELHQMAAWPDCPRLFAHFRDLAAPLRLADLPAYVRTLDARLLPGPDATTFQGTPMRHRQLHVGHFFLAGKAGAQAGLEILVETSSVGVVVFDARSGHPVSFNREARQIVEALRTSDHPLEELLGVITCRRADGREVSLAEIPIAQQLSSGERVLAEEVVLSLPDGRSVRTLVNSGPVRSADGEVESVVVTLQNLARCRSISSSDARSWPW